MVSLTGLEFVTEMVDLLVQVSGGGDVLGRLSHEKCLGGVRAKQKR